MADNNGTARTRGGRGRGNNMNKKKSKDGRSKKQSKDRRRQDAAMNQEVSLDSYWLQCIEDGTACVRGGNDIVNVDFSLSYLVYLQKFLVLQKEGSKEKMEAANKLHSTIQDEEMDGSVPIAFANFAAGHADWGEGTVDRRTNGDTQKGPQASLVPSQIFTRPAAKTKSNPSPGISPYQSQLQVAPASMSAYNPFASLAFSDDEDSSKEDDDDASINADEETEDPNEQDDTLDQQQQEDPEISMTIRRLLIRIYTAQSDVIVRKAMLMSQIVFAASKGHDDAASIATGRSNLPKRWTWCDIAMAYAQALKLTRFALELADMQISQWIADHFQVEQQREQLQLLGLVLSEPKPKHVKADEDHAQRQKEELIQDANIVQVAITSLVQSVDKYMRMAESRKAWLESKLEPQWESRDEMKQKWGADKWKNNPAPTHSYAKQRAHHERQHKDIVRAMEVLQDKENDVHELQGMFDIQISSKLRDQTM